MAEEPDSPQIRVRGKLAAAGVAILLTVLVIFARVRQRNMAERDALEFVRLNGYTNEGYEHNLISIAIERVRPASNRIPLAVDPLIGVAFPSDRMSDTMVAHLLNISDLHAITLYPPDRTGSGLDFEATVITKVNSLSGLNLPVSEDSVAQLEERFPNLIIQVANRPAEGSETSGDVTNERLNSQ